MKLPYIEKIKDIIESIDTKEYKNFFDIVNSAKIIIFIGEGRSFYSIRVGMSEVHKGDISVMKLYGKNFPGKNIKEALPRLQKMAKQLKGNVVLLVNSSSGETETPKDALEDFEIALEHQNKKNIMIAGITGNSNSTVGRISEKFGAILNIKTEPNDGNNIMQLGIMNDIYELATLLILHITKKTIVERENTKYAIKEMLKEAKFLTRKIPKIIEKREYKSLAGKIIEKNDILFGALGPGKNVADITSIRIRHIRGPMGYSTYTSGPFSSKPRPVSTAAYISKSGETRPVVKWAKSNVERKVLTYCITRNAMSQLATVAQPIIIESSEDNFYERAVFALSPLPLLAVEELDTLGFKLPQEIMQWYHSSTE